MSGLIYTILTGPNFGWAYLQPVTKITDINKYRLNFYEQFDLPDQQLINEQFYTGKNIKTLNDIQKLDNNFLKFHSVSTIKQFQTHLPEARAFSQRLQNFDKLPNKVKHTFMRHQKG